MKRSAENCVVLTIKRYYQDLDEQETRPFEFDAKVASAWVDFFPTVLRTFKGPKAGQPFELMEWA